MNATAAKTFDSLGADAYPQGQILSVLRECVADCLRFPARRPRLCTGLVLSTGGRKKKDSLEPPVVQISRRATCSMGELGIVGCQLVDGIVPVAE